MTLNEFIDKLIQIKTEYNAGDFSVKIPYYFDLEYEGTFVPWCDTTDITDEEICINKYLKTLTIYNKDDTNKQ